MGGKIHQNLPKTPGLLKYAILLHPIPSLGIKLFPLLHNVFQMHHEAFTRLLSAVY